MTENISGHSSVSQEDIFDIAYLDSCLQIFRLSPFLSEKEREKEKESAVVSKKLRLSVGTYSFQPKVTLQEATLALSCQGQDILLAFSKSLYDIFVFFQNNLSLIFNAYSITKSTAV